jgi:hypothetical protein
MDSRILRIESSVAKAVRRYLDYPDDGGIPDIGDALARLLGWNWEARGLEPPKTFDGLERSVIKILSPHDVSIVGLVSTLSTQEVEWFRAEIRLAPDHDVVDSYALRFGVKGLPAAPYEAVDQLWSQGVLESAPAWHWVHEFERADAIRS